MWIPESPSLTHRRQRLLPARANGLKKRKVPRPVRGYNMDDFVPILLPQLNLLNVDPKQFLDGDARDVA